MTMDIVEQAVMVCPQCEGEGCYPDGLDEAACCTECTRCVGNGWIVDVEKAAAEILSLRARVAELEEGSRKALVAFTVIETLSPVWSMGIDENMERLKSVAREASATLSKGEATEGTSHVTD